MPADERKFKLTSWPCRPEPDPSPSLGPGRRILFPKCPGAHRPSGRATRGKAARPAPKPNVPAAALTPEVREHILMEQLPQVYSIARHIHGRLPSQIELGDLTHAGVVGLLEALRNYNPSKMVELKSYAKFRIRGAILDSLRALDWSPRVLRRKARLLEDAHQRLRNRLGRSATEPELAAQLGMSLRDLQRLLGDLGGLELASLEEEFAEGRGGDPSPTLEDDPHSRCLRGELRQMLTQAMAELRPRQRQVLALYYYQELTMKEVAAVLGVTESRISRMHSAALVRLRERVRQQLEPPSRHHVLAGQCRPIPTDTPSLVPA